jgi:hypothetical protein
MVSKAITNGTFRVDYISTRPETGGIYYKSVYAEKVTGSDERIYVVGSGIYQ